MDTGLSGHSQRFMWTLVCVDSRDTGLCDTGLCALPALCGTGLCVTGLCNTGLCGLYGHWFVITF